MVKFREDDIVLDAGEKVVQDSNTVIGSNSAGNFNTLNVTARLKIPTSAPETPEAGDLWIE